MQRTVLVAHMSGDVYGSDLQLLESVSALVDRGWQVVVALAKGGPLVQMLRDRGAEVCEVGFPVLSHAHASFAGILRLATASPSALIRIRRLIRAVRPQVVYVNTVTLPWWLLAARISSTPVLCHVHEAEDVGSRAILFALNLPLLLANQIISNSQASIEATCRLVPGLRSRTRLIYNGVPSPDETLAMPDFSARPCRILVVGRLSPRKAQEVALEAVAILRSEGKEVDLEICGTPFKGYEWYEDLLRQRAEQEDLDGHVTLSGYVSPIWRALARAQIVVAPSSREPFGNAVVEAQLGMRPVVASGAMGHKETVQDGVTGLLVEPGDARAMAEAVGRLMADTDLAKALSLQGRSQAMARFSTARYKADVVDTVECLAVQSEWVVDDGGPSGLVG